MTELKQYMADNKRIKVAQWNKERQGNHCQGFTQKEFEQSMDCLLYTSDAADE